MAKARPTKPTPGPVAASLEPPVVAGDGSVLFQLNHCCHRPGCEGQSGEVIRVSAEDADYLLARQGGVRCDAAGVPVKRDKPAIAAVLESESEDDDGDSGEDDSSRDGE